MNKNIRIVFAVLALFGSSAASAGVTDMLSDIGRAAQRVLGKDHAPTLVLAPGIRLNVGDRVVRVYGYDKCPRDPHDWMGNPPEDGCVVLDKTVVSVMFEDQTKEQWTVKTEGERTYLIRPNGVRVSQ